VVGCTKRIGSGLVRINMADRRDVGARNRLIRDIRPSELECKVNVALGGPERIYPA
jgi:hypothetical protein